MTPYGCVNETGEPVQSVPCYVSVIQSEGELVDVAAQMLLAGMVVNAMQTALQDRPNAFNAVGAHAVQYVLARTVVNCVVFEKQTVEAGITGMIVSVKG